mmetsp:Transcript_17808/g.29761  ORF Transcript_17808/g.29761 Transcript_17808/m.29761 type:complete len:135 (+) Transcript_17808:98-502(+)
MCLSCVVSSVDKFVKAVDTSSKNENDEPDIGKTFEGLVYCLDAAARFDHSDKQFPWAKAVAVLAPQMTSACRTTGKFEAPPRKRMLEYARNALIRLTSVQYSPQSADNKHRLDEALERVRNLESLNEIENQINK